MIDDRLPDPTLGYGYCRAHRIVAELLTQTHRLSFLPLHAKGSRGEFNLGVTPLASFDEAGRLLPTFDAVWVSRLSNLRMVRIKAPEFLTARRWLYDCEALHSTRNALWAALGYRPSTPQLLDVAEEAALWGDATVTIAAARKDAAALAEHGARVDEVVGHAMAVVAGSRKFADRSGILFLGSFLNFGKFSPNWDAIRFILSAIWPGLRMLDTTLTVAGHGALRALAALGVDEPGIRVESDVVDLADLYDRHRVVIAPTRFASGIPWKLHEAFGFGVPAVVSTVLAAQMVVETPQHADYFNQWSAATPDDYVRAVRKLYCEEQAWEAARRTALAVFSDGCASDRFAESISRCIDKLGGSEAGGI